MSDKLCYTSDDAFDDDVIKSKLPAFVHFWAEWCGPSKMIQPGFEALAADYEGKVTFVMLNIDENSQTPAKHGVRGIPTMMLFENGEVVGTKVGAMAKDQLKKFLDANT